MMLLKIPSIRSLAALLLPLCLSVAARAQTTWYVDASATPPGAGTTAAPFKSIQFAISRPTTVAGDRLSVAPGAYPGTVDFRGKALTIVSQQGAEHTTIVGQQSDSVVVAGPGTALDTTLLRGFTITGGASRAGGGIGVEGGGLTVRDCVVENNTAERGGGVYVSNSSVLIEDCTIAYNVATGNAWVHAPTGGGLYVCCGSACTVRTSTFESNLARYDQHGFADGGGAWCDATSSLLVANSQLLRNTAGEFWATGGDWPGRGGGIFGAPDVTIVDSTIAECDANIGGGGFHGSGELLRCVIRGNRGQLGGGLHITGTTRVRESLIVANQGESQSGTYHEGGGVYGPATLMSCEITGNFSWGNGGGIFGATALDCLIWNNQALVPDRGFQAFGGGAMDSVLVRCRVYQNSVLDLLQDGSGTWGGGAYGSDLRYCEVFSNDAEFGGGGASCRLESTTVVGNDAGIAGDGLHGGSTVRNSIVWGNHLEAIADPGGGLAVLYSDVQGGWPGLGNIAQDPLFWCVSIDDYFLTSDSPCINTGDPGAMDPDGSPKDMGARPYDPTHEGAAEFYCTGKTNSFGCVPFLSATGVPRSSPSDPFVITAHDVAPQEAGFLLYGVKKSNLNFHGGKLCVKVPFLRSSLKSAKNVGGGCSGWILRSNFNKTIQNGSDPRLTPGQRIVAQWRQRDPMEPAGFGDGLSDAVQFTICP